MHAQQAEGWTRRRFLGGLTVAGTVGLVGQHARAVADPSSPVIQEVAVRVWRAMGPRWMGPATITSPRPLTSRCTATPG